MDPELEAIRRARMQQMQGGGEQAAQVRLFLLKSSITSKLPAEIQPNFVDI